MSFYEFALQSPVLAGIFAFFAFLIINTIMVYCVNRPLRCLNIRKHGWPPPHCDADGDFKDPREDEE